MGRPTGAISTSPQNEQPLPEEGSKEGRVVGMNGPALALFAALQNATKIDHGRKLSLFFRRLTLARMQPIARTSQLARPAGNLV
jgi:hypothetical protein